jgi:hypothetical protein
VRTLRASAIALICLAPLSQTFNASEDPLPLAQPKSAETTNETPQSSAAPDLFVPASIVMEVFPITDFATKAIAIQTSDPGTLLDMLRDAVATNDMEAFDAALSRARTVAESSPELRRAVSVYSDLQQVWHFSANDRFGAFYDDESLPGVRQRLSTEYSGYASYINEHRIVDQNGRAFYPTAETRTFLLKQVGTPHIASHAKAPATTTAITTATATATPKPARHVSTPAPAPAPAHEKHVAPATTPIKHKKLKKADTIVPPKPVAIAEKKPEPVKVAPVPIEPPKTTPVATAQPTTTPAATTHVATTQAPPPAPETTQSTAPTPTPVPAPAPTTTVATTPTTTEAPVSKEASDNNPAILILILGVVALGVTMFLLRRSGPKPAIQTLTPKPELIGPPKAAPAPAPAPSPSKPEATKPEAAKAPEGEKPAPRQASGSR